MFDRASSCSHSEADTIIQIFRSHHTCTLTLKLGKLIHKFFQPIIYKHSLIVETISGGFWCKKGTYLYNIQLRAKRDHNSKTYQTSLVWMTVFYQVNKHFSSCRARWWTTWWRGSAPCSRWAASSTTRGTASVSHQVSGNFNIILIETHLSSRESTTAVKYNIQ